tara:strand:+ start:93 stop:599 length:507 start_codon:yes stop_codon:yes gene_type:complete
MGFKKTSDLIAISFDLNESAPNTFTQEQVALQLDVLNNEIAVVLAIDLDMTAPDALAGLDTRVTGAVTTTSQTGMTGLGNTNTMATSRMDIRAQGFVDGGVAFDRAADSSYTGGLDYIALIATNNFFVGILGANNIAAKNVSGRVWLYRAKADASTYAALVQSEVLSA